MAESNLALHVGTSGYSYKEWKGSFYPKDLPAAQMLEFYAQRFGAVNTFDKPIRQSTPLYRAHRQLARL